MDLIKKLLERWKTEYDFKTFITASGMLAMNVIFAFYNGFLGIYRSSLWHGTICVYHIILILLRGTILLSAKKIYERKEQDSAKHKVYLRVSVLLLIVNICLVVPIVLIIKQQTYVNMSQFSANAIAAFTVYKIIIASSHLKKRKVSSDCLTQMLRTINFIDALVSILTLQNTLIMVHSGGGDLRLIPLTSVSSTVIWCIILFLSISSITKGVRQIRSGG